jgi:hypothetical protein
MKKLIAYITSICFGIFLISGTVSAQSGSEIKFNVIENPLTTDKNLATVSTVVNAKQSVGSGIHFTLIVHNNSGKDIAIKNIADRLSVALYNEKGLNISIPNYELSGDTHRSYENRKWKFRSESVSPDKVYVNGKEDKNNIKELEYLEIPAGGNCKVNLMIKNVKQVETAEDIQNKSSKPTINLEPGKYKLRMFLSIITKEAIKSGGFVISFQSPKIDIDYNK